MGKGLAIEAWTLGLAFGVLTLWLAQVSILYILLAIQGQAFEPSTSLGHKLPQPLSSLDGLSLSSLQHEIQRQGKAKSRTKLMCLLRVRIPHA